MAATFFYPPETIEEILLRLPVKALCRFKCVSKHWKTLISSNRFIKIHLNHSSRLQIEKLIFASDVKGSLYSVNLIDLINTGVSRVKATKLRCLPRGFIGVIGSCNGLALSTLDDDEGKPMLVINTTSGECIEVNLIKEEPGYEIDEMEVLGFGYDSMRDDYKIIMIASWDIKDKGRVRLASVFSLRSNMLRDIKPPTDYAPCILEFAVYLNECLHWLCQRVSNSSCFIAGFSLRHDKFVEMELPSFFNKVNVVDLLDKLYVLGGCLCFMPCGNKNLTELWVMKAYGVKESWKKISIDGLGTPNVEPLWLLADREVVLLVDVNVVVVYNLEEKTLRKVKISGVPDTFEVAGTWVESLVTPKHYNRFK